MDKIIDVSEWNTIESWDKVSENIDAAILRMGFTYSRTGYMCLDKSYLYNKQACKRLNIPYSLYYFTNAITIEEAYREADFVANECRDFKTYILPVFVDAEKVDGAGRADNLDRATRTECVRAFCSRLQYKGIPAGIYANPDMIRNGLDMSRLPFSLWIAHWGVTEPDVTDYLIWQYTNTGSVPGIIGNVDISRTMPISQDHMQNIIRWFKNEVGYLEKKSGDLAYLFSKTENAGYNNYTKYGYDLKKLSKNIDYPAPWCMCFISAAFVEEYGYDGAKRALCGDIDDYCPQAVQRFMLANRWSSEPHMGDLVFFGDNVASHVEYVYYVDDKRIYTIGGNTSAGAAVIENGGAVCRKDYSITNQRILGYGRPVY